MSYLQKFPMVGWCLVMAMVLPTPALAAADVVGVDVISADDGVRVEIQATGEYTYRTFWMHEPTRFVVDVIGGVNRLAADRFAGDGQLVRSVRTSQYQPLPDAVTRVVLDMAGNAVTSIDRSGSGLAVSLIGTRGEVEASQAYQEARPAQTPPEPSAASQQVVWQTAQTPLELDLWQTPESGLSQVAEPVQRDVDASYARTMSINVQNGDIKTVLRAIADFSGRNIITSPDVTGLVTVALTDVPWVEALGVILRANAFGFVEENGIIRVDTAENLRNEELARKAAAKQSDDLEALTTEVVTIDFANAEEVKDAVQHMLTGRGSVEVDTRTNALIVNDIPSRVKELATLARELDTRTPQVHIDALLVDLDSRRSRELGIEWGAFNLNPNSNVVGDVQVSNPIENVAGQLRVGTVNNFGDLRMSIQAMARENIANIISNPRITTTNNREASILVGQKIPLITTDVAGNPITRLETIGIRLVVTPHINSDDKITLDIHPEVSDLSSQATVQGGVIINTSEADTRVLVNNEQTAVIAGLIRNNNTTFISGVPVLKDIPLLGNLFRSESKTNDQRELIVFLTPRIVSDDSGMSDRESEMKGKVDSHLRSNYADGPSK